ncbi:GIY-YIG nuclease family protein [Nocardioides sp.]|uniref:GIY-YIG nuclease family protein n=1 Tax=Nocardioides sp. TaxID=35761 RepID=UPI0027221185|nr:GIY-YIG nuclease family protein [Nocardioides sp.]MDO9455219.1 GIY-YIG nuclease family protein [Nocardioides sp.]
MLESAGIAAEDAIVIRHVFKTDADHLRGPEDLADRDKLLLYTSRQGVDGKAFPAKPPRYWIVCIGEGRNARLITVYDNHGEVERWTAEDGFEGRTFDLQETDLLDTYRQRLTITWSNPRRWCVYGPTAAKGEVVSLADPVAEPFPGFDSLILTQAQLRTVVNDPLYQHWRTALESVQGIYLMTDSSDGRHYVGQTAGGQRILGRWSQYAGNGHGGNKELLSLFRDDPLHAEHFVYSLLRVFGPSVDPEVVYAAESHYKNALMTRQPFGLNYN